MLSVTVCTVVRHRLQLGRAQSLVVPYQLPESRARLWPHGCGVVRFAIGLADAQDLQNDLAQSLDAL